jgi:heme A synthase
MNSRKMSSVALAAAAAVMFSTAFVGTAVAGDEAKVKCEGVNSCKGHSACKTANNACKGQNSCKGQGFLEMSKKECAAAKDKMKSDSK